MAIAFLYQLYLIPDTTESHLARTWKFYVKRLCLNQLAWYDCRVIHFSDYDTDLYDLSSIQSCFVHDI